MKIEDIDKNFKPVETDESGFDWYDVDDLEVYGLLKDEKGYMRMPSEIAQKVNDGVAYLYRNTAGGRARFSTKSPEIAIKVVFDGICRFPHMSLEGTAGFSLFADYEGDESQFVNAFIPPVSTENEFTVARKVSEEFNGAIGFTLFFPLYNSVKSVLVGVKHGYEIKGGKKYINDKPVVFYGSSITQGGCASVAGNDYIGLLSARLNIDILNLGFSGSARGEDVMSDYIRNLEMSAFVYDYDHNAPSVEHYEKTHAHFFNRFRAVQPDTPVLMMTKPDMTSWAIVDRDKRRGIAYNTYRDAILRGDKNVYFIDGQSLVDGRGKYACFVDTCHPNDLGFYRMANTIEPVLKKMLNL